MERIPVQISAYILALFPLSGGGGSSGRGARLGVLDSGLAAPSFWSSDEIMQTFREANRIWLREANIHFTPINILRRSECVPADEHGMWIHFINHLRPAGRGIGVGFVYDLPSNEGGWGGGHIAVLSGKKARSGIAGFAGNLLAHELGHVLIEDPNHEHAGGDRSNLMHGNRNPRIANAGLLTPEQVRMARARAASI